MALGGVLVAGGLLAYLIGIRVPYPGRAFSLTALMIGTTLLAVGLDADDGSGAGEERR